MSLPIPWTAVNKLTPKYLTGLYFQTNKQNFLHSTMKLKLSRLAHATTVKKNENNKLNPLADTDDLSYYYRSKCCENQINKIEKKKIIYYSYFGCL